MKRANRVVVVVVALTAVVVCGCSEREPEPQYAARLTCHLDEIGSGSGCSTVIWDPNEQQDVNPAKRAGSMRCGWTGNVSEISWRFVRHKGAKDIYSFERRFPVDGLNPQVTSQTVAFDGVQVVVFEDEHQVIVLDTPQ